MTLRGLIGGKNAEYHLEDVNKMSKLYPRTFLIPSKKAIDTLMIGDLVKLIFVMEEASEDGCRAERMWVKITNIHKGRYIGTLDNEPYRLKTIAFGDYIEFKSSNIASIYSDESNLNEELFAIITKKALANQQVNWVIRTDDLNNKQDSGWQLFYGDESESYLDDVQNASIVSLKHVLAFEPLLEDVFRSSGKAYEYSKKLNRFIETER